MPKIIVDDKLIERKERPMILPVCRDDGIAGHEDRVARYAKVAALLDKWANEPGDFDERVDPVIEKALPEQKSRR